MDRDNLVSDQETEQVNVQVEEQVDLHEKIVNYCLEPKTEKNNGTF